MIVLLFVCVMLFAFNPQYLQIRLILCAVVPLMSTMVRAVSSKVSWAHRDIDITPRPKSADETVTQDVYFDFENEARQSAGGRDSTRAESAADTTVVEDDVNISVNDTSLVPDHPHVPDDVVSESESKSRASPKWLPTLPPNLADTFLEDLEIDLPAFGDEGDFEIEPLQPAEQRAIVPVGWLDFDFDVDAADILGLPESGAVDQALPLHALPLPATKFMQDMDVFDAFDDFEQPAGDAQDAVADFVRDDVTLPPTVGNAWSEPPSEGHKADIISSDSDSTRVRKTRLRTYQRYSYFLNFCLVAASLLGCYYLTFHLEALGQCPNFSISVILAVLVYDLVFVQTLYCCMLAIRSRDIVGDGDTLWKLHPYDREVRDIQREGIMGLPDVANE